MCGIAGFAATVLPESALTTVARMVKSMERRGPDSGGIREWKCAVLGHRRLSIFDLSEAGSQLMVSVDGNVAIVFNGAIYNFHELRLELEGAGHIFRSQTD